MISVLIQRWPREDRHTENALEEEGRSDASMSQGMPKIAADHQKFKMKQRRIPLPVSEGVSPGNTMILDV